MRGIRKLGRRLLYGGFGGPKPYESEILAATVAALPEPDARALRQQIGLIERLQRWNDDRMVIVGFEDKAALPKLVNEATDHCLAKLRVTGASGSVTASVMTHRGILSSLEFRPSPRKLGGGDVTVELRELDAETRGEAAAIDREEHT
jgi:uncharacterized protein (DUF1330 family)